MGLVDEVIPEPLGGAHKEPDEVASRIADCLEKQLATFEQKTSEQIIEERYQRLLNFGEFQD
jgi:acetyl-CoA carboxylase carboxyl transferase subunit alpha